MSDLAPWKWHRGPPPSGGWPTARLQSGQDQTVAKLSRDDVDERMDAVLSEAQEYFMGEGGIHKAAAAIGRLLEEARIDYAFAGAIALAEHGFRRLTTDVDVLIRREDLARFKAQWRTNGRMRRSMWG